MILIFVLLGGSLGAIMAVLYASGIKYSLRGGCTSRAIGTVTKISETFSSSGRTTYYPVCSFRDKNGEEFKVITSVTRKRKEVNVGDTFMVRYDPKNPSAAYIHFGRVSMLTFIGLMVLIMFIATCTAIKLNII